MLFMLMSELKIFKKICYSKIIINREFLFASLVVQVIARPAEPISNALMIDYRF